MNRSQLLKKMQSINNLPTIPIIALEVNRLLKDFESPVDELVQLLEKDQSLVVKILRLVNSSFYGFKSKVKSLRHSVTLLGYNTVRNAVVTVTVIDALSLKKELKGFEIGAFWRHSIQVAAMSRYLAAKTRLAACEDAFTAGLLHDIGKVVLASFFSDELARILSTAADQQTTFFDAEHKLDCTPHTLIGSYLAQRWMLPEDLANSIQYHHSDVNRSSQSQLIALVNIGNRLVHMMAGDAGYSLNPDHQQEGESSLHAIMNCMKNETNWLPQVKKDMDAACEFFSKG